MNTTNLSGFKLFYEDLVTTPVINKQLKRLKRNPAAYLTDSGATTNATSVDDTSLDAEDDDALVDIEELTELADLSEIADYIERTAKSTTSYTSALTDDSSTSNKSSTSSPTDNYIKHKTNYYPGQTQAEPAKQTTSSSPDRSYMTYRPTTQATPVTNSSPDRLPKTDLTNKMNNQTNDVYSPTTPSPSDLDSQTYTHATLISPVTPVKDKPVYPDINDISI